MSLFGIGSRDKKYGALIDIGSGSVLVAIVESNPSSTHPIIIWSHRELAPLKNVDSLEQSVKTAMTALVNASMKLDSEGRRALSDHNSSAALTELQCGISAPWAYTITKTVNYKQDEDFVITKTLIDDLLNSAKDSTAAELNQNEEVSNLGLTTIARAAISTLANGYAVSFPEDQKAKTLTISYSNAISQKLLIAAVDEMRDKLFPKTQSRKISFMLYPMFRCASLFTLVNFKESASKT